MRHTNKHEYKGFTIVELLVATAVFSLVLIVFMTAFLRISQLFYKGVNMAKTQEAARNVVQDISDDLQFYRDNPTIGALGANWFCVGIHRYTYYIGQQVGSGGANKGILRDVVGSGCPSPVSGIQPLIVSKAEQLLDPGMQVNRLDLSDCGNSHCTIAVHIVFYGSDSSVLVSPSNQVPTVAASDAICSGPVSGTQFCATADYKSTVLQNF